MRSINEIIDALHFVDKQAIARDILLLSQDKSIPSNSPYHNLVNTIIEEGYPKHFAHTLAENAIRDYSLTVLTKICELDVVK